MKIEFAVDFNDYNPSKETCCDEIRITTEEEVYLFERDRDEYPPGEFATFKQDCLRAVAGGHV